MISDVINRLNYSENDSMNSNTDMNDNLADPVVLVAGIPNIKPKPDYNDFPFG